jgi:hypothetical protein
VRSLGCPKATSGACSSNRQPVIRNTSPVNLECCGSLESCISADHTATVAHGLGNVDRMVSWLTRSRLHTVEHMLHVSMSNLSSDVAAATWSGTPLVPPAGRRSARRLACTSRASSRRRACDPRPGAGGSSRGTAGAFAGPPRRTTVATRTGPSPARSP